MAHRPRDRAYGGAASYPRTRRINQVLREVIAEEIERLADADERLRMVTVTEVDTAADLDNAVVYFSSLSDDAGEALEERRGQLQRQVARLGRFGSVTRRVVAVAMVDAIPAEEVLVVCADRLAAVAYSPLSPSLWLAGRACRRRSPQSAAPLVSPSLAG